MVVILSIGCSGVNRLPGIDTGGSAATVGGSSGNGTTMGGSNGTLGGIQASGGSGATLGGSGVTFGGSQAGGSTGGVNFCPTGVSTSGGVNATGGTPAAATGCGDGILLYKMEECDDGNLQSGDGCSSTCKIEPGWTCDVPGRPCRLPNCGNGLIESPETCDDFNDVGGDGCSAQCTVENGWVCAPSGLTAWNCYHARCGDGRVNNLPYVNATGRALQETCDDGNDQPGDGCSDQCTIENGWVCTRPSGIGQHLGPLSRLYVVEDFMPPCLKIVCGDGIIEANEQCDDGNAASGDGCSTNCELEPDFDCITAGQPCIAIICGDGIIEPPETCDDGNAQPGDGCDQNCQYDDTGLICDPPGQPCHAPVCGDGISLAPEECDDGNTASGDGCTSDCKLEPGYACDPEGAPCHIVRCGDGILDGIERVYYNDAGTPQTDTCDDGNTVSGDGCSSICRIEAGWTCDTPGEACRPPTCGNGRYEAPEQCDDGNTQAGDGCSATCTLEPGYSCAKLGAACQALCGNGKLEEFGVPCSATWYEECDDGNTQAGDGCAPNCKLEPGWECGVPATPCWST